MGPALSIVKVLLPSGPRLDPELAPHLRSGQQGEKAAARFLKQQGYQVLVRNYSSRWGEIDLVCRHQKTLVFVEVKTRAEDSWDKPAAAVTRSKQRRLIRTAHAYLQELEERDIPTRFDVVEVYLDDFGQPRCELLPHAFSLNDGNRI
ncbi:MAG: YraN family protein [Blastochloris sp.]|nr:YraN family protein [Blastochloris sp.]